MKNRKTYKRDYYLKDQEHWKAYARNYYYKNKEKITEYRLKNKEKLREYDKIYTSPYHEMTTSERLTLAADIASGNGRCWWIKTFLISNRMSPKKLKYRN